MQNNTNKKKTKGMKPIFKPYLKGRPVSSLSARRGLHIFGYMLLFTVLYLVIGSALTFDNVTLRIICNIALVGMTGLLYYNDGAGKGENDTSFAEIVLNRQNEGHKVPDSEKDNCFHPLKGFFTVLVGVAPFLICALIYAFLAEKQTYSLGVLPSWVSAYEDQAEIGDALAYYSETHSITLAEILRVIVRMINFPFVNMVGTDNKENLLLMDRLSPLFVLLVPSLYGVGYMRGPYLRALVHGNIRQNKRKHNTRERKAREQRARQARQPQKKELI